MAKETDRFPLSELAKALREDLDKMQADLAKDNKEAALFLDSAEIEVTVGFEKSATAEAGVKVSVFGFGAKGGTKGEIGSQTGHRLKLILKPDTKVGVASHG